MALIIEGCDLAGKTTLANALGWLTPIRDKSDRGHNSIANCTVLPLGNFTIDRWWPSEFIYGKYLRQTNMVIELIKEFKELSDKKGAVMIWLNPTIEEVIIRYQNRGDPEIEIKDLLNIRMEYVKFMNKYEEYLPPLYVKERLTEALIHHAQLQKDLL